MLLIYLHVTFDNDASHLLALLHKIQYVANINILPEPRLCDT